MGAGRLEALSRLGESLLPRISPRRGAMVDGGWTTVLTPRGLLRAAPGVTRQAIRSGADLVVVTLDVVDVTVAGSTEGAAGVHLQARRSVEDPSALVGDLLEVSVRTTDRVARTSPHRFAVLLAAGSAFAADTAERLHRGARRTVRPYGLGVRVGVARRAAVDCTGPAEAWLGGMIDEAATGADLGGGR